MRPNKPCARPIRFSNNFTSDWVVYLTNIWCDVIGNVPNLNIPRTPKWREQATLTISGFRLLSNEGNEHKTILT